MFGIRFPVIRERVVVNHKNLRSEILGLEEGKRTGFARISLAKKRYYLFLDTGYPVGAGVEGETGKHLEAPSVVIDELEKSLRMEKGTMDAYQVPSELVHLLLGYFAAKTVAEDLAGELMDLAKMVDRLRNANFTGFLWGRGKREVVVFLSYGEVVGVFVNGKKTGLPEAQKAIVNCRVSLLNTEKAVDIESLIFSREVKVRFMENLYSQTYNLVKKAHNGAEGFELLVREAMMVRSGECPYLNPFFGLIELRSGRLRVDPGVDPDALAGDFCRALYAGAKAYLSDDPDVARRVLGLIESQAADAGVALKES